MKTLVVANGKGGVGKTTIAALLVEYCNDQGIPVSLTDTDPNETLRKWVEFCAEEGRRVTHNPAAIHIVDTAGTGGSALRHLKTADLIVCPFKANFADVDLVAEWFESLNPTHQSKFVFVPNMRGLAGEQRKIIEDVEALVSEIGRGHCLSKYGLWNRDAIYPDLLKGHPKNFFAIADEDLQTRQRRSYANAKEEARTLCDQILAHVREGS